MKLQGRTLLERLNVIERSLSVTHNKIATFLLKSGHKAAFLTAAEIASSVGASESTVVRFARMLGFHGYPELQDFLRQGLLETLSPVDRLIGSDEIQDKSKLVEHLADREISNLRAAFETVDYKALQELVEAICAARTCYIVGLRSSRSPAILLGHYLTKIAPKVTVIVSSDSMFEQLSWATEKDVLIAYSFPRYSKATVDAIQIAKSAGAPTSAITDSHNSPAAQLSDYSLIAPAISDFYGNSFVAAVAITNLLLAFCVHAQPDAVRQNLNRLEKVASLSERFVRLTGDKDHF
jgi:DNA-binding MurR/RpiR family transcriptional regulator